MANKLDDTVKMTDMILSILTKSVKFLFSIDFAIGILFLNQHLQWIEISKNEIVNTYIKDFAGLGFCLITLYLLGLALFGIGNYIINKIKYHFYNKQEEKDQKSTVTYNQRNTENIRSKIKKYLEELPQKEIAIIREFGFQKQDLIAVDYLNPNVVSLIQKQIIEQVTTTGEQICHMIVIKVQLSAFAKEIIYEDISKYFRLKNNPTSTEKQQVMQERPEFVKQIESVNNMWNMAFSGFQGL